MNTITQTANPANISICSGNSPNGTTGGADSEKEKQGLSDAEHRRKTAAHPRLAVLPEQSYNKRNRYRGY